MASENQQIQQEQAKKLEIFPILTLLSKYSNVDRDVRVSQNILLIFQIREIKALYILLRMHVPGFKLALPIHFKHEGDKETTLWVIEVDSCGLGSFEIGYAQTIVTKNKTGIEVKVNFFNGFNMTPVFGQIPALVALILKAIDQDDFNEAFIAFQRLMGEDVKKWSKKFKPYFWLQTFSHGL